MLKLKLQHVGHLMQRTDSLEKTLMLGKTEGGRRRGRQRSTHWTWVWVNSGSWWWTGRPDVLQSMGSQRVRHTWATKLNWRWGDSVMGEGCYHHYFVAGEAEVERDWMICLRSRDWCGAEMGFEGLGFHRPRANHSDKWPSLKGCREYVKLLIQNTTTEE